MHSLLKGFRLCHALCILSRSLLAVHAHSVLFLPMQRQVSDTLSQALCNLSLAFLADFTLSDSTALIRFIAFSRKLHSAFRLDRKT